jgi:hypothetical protein
MTDDAENVRLQREVLRPTLIQAEARGAMAMIRATVEILVPIGAMRSREELDSTFVADALEIIRGIQAIADHRSPPH